MSLKITDECISCGACEAECPNTAIYEDGAEYELNGETYEAISDDYYYIVADKCTECKGSFDESQCVEVCPVDCIVVDKEEDEATLMARFEKLNA